MVKLFNITVNDNIIACDYIPENSNKVGKVFVNTETRDIVDVIYSEYEYAKKTFVAHVRAKLSELLDSGKPIPKEAYSVWY